jgi:hypothetical protein
MDIAYLVRASDFLAPCEAAIHAERDSLETGNVVRITLKPGGYAGCVKVTVGTSRREFQSDWQRDRPDCRSGSERRQQRYVTPAYVVSSKSRTTTVC